MYWCVTQATGNWLMFINCHRKQGFTKLYEEMNELSDQLQSIKVDVNTRKFQRNHIILLSAAVFACFVNGALKFWDLATDELLDPMFGQAWNNRNNSYEVFISVKVVSQTAFSLMLIKWMGYPACFVSAAYSCCHLLSEFNKTFSTKVDKSARDAVLEIETYRTMHLKLCEFVDRTNKLFYIMLGNMMMNYIAIMLILLYLLAGPSSRPTTVIEIITMIYWILCSGFLCILIIVFSQKVLDEVS